MKLILLGAPGSGKGTQAEKLSGTYGVPHISTGNMFRQELKDRTPLGLEAGRYMETGGLVPDSIVIKIVNSRLDRDDCSRGFILDGYPRNLIQGQALDGKFAASSIRIDRIVFIKVEDAEIIKRISSRRVCSVCGRNFNLLSNSPATEGVCEACGGALIQREDDTEASIETRLRIFRDETFRLIEYYRAEDRPFSEVDGMGSEMEIFRKIIGKIDNRQ